MKALLTLVQVMVLAIARQVERLLVQLPAGPLIPEQYSVTSELPRARQVILLLCLTLQCAWSLSELLVVCAGTFIDASRLPAHLPARDILPAHKHWHRARKGPPLVTADHQVWQHGELS